MEQVHGVQSKMVLAVIIFEFLKYFFFALVLLYLPDARCGDYTWPMVTANNICKYFLKYE